MSSEADVTGAAPSASSEASVEAPSIGDDTNIISLGDSTPNGQVTVIIKRSNTTDSGHKTWGKCLLRCVRVDGRVVIRAAKESVASTCALFGVVPRPEGGEGLRPQTTSKVNRNGKELYIVIVPIKDISKAVNLQSEGEEIIRQFSRGEDRIYHIYFSSIETAQNFADVCYEDSLLPVPTSSGEDSDDNERSLSGNSDVYSGGNDDATDSGGEDDSEEDEGPYIEESQDAYHITNTFSSWRIDASANSHSTVEEEEDE